MASVKQRHDFMFEIVLATVRIMFRMAKNRAGNRLGPVALRVHTLFMALPTRAQVLVATDSGW